MEKCHFSGWATRNDLLCSDGRTIRKNAFMHNDGETVPLVWNHGHNDPENVIGHALLENRDEGVYAYCSFNNGKKAKEAKEAVMHGDVRSLSIYANQLKPAGSTEVLHGTIREVSIVLAGANPGAFIDSVMAHSDTGSNTEIGLILNYDENAILCHADENVSEVDEDLEEKKVETESDNEEKLEHSDEKKEDNSVAENEKTVQEVFDEFTDEQKDVVYAMIGMALEDNGADDDDEEIEHSFEGGNENMKKNLFENDNQQSDVLMHSEILNDAIADAKRFGSLKESVIQHAAVNNITDINELFPDAKNLTATPTWIKEDDSWVAKVMGGVKRSPFSRIKALFAQMDENEARARGYIKGNSKADTMKLAVLKRTTQPTTVYVKMKMDRDDVQDISYDVIPWLKSELRGMLDHELARAILIGDGRDPSSDDKIDELCIRPILTDDDMYTISYTVTDGKDFHNDFNSASENDSEAKGVIRAAIKSRKQYKGSGTPTLFTTEDLLTELLLIEDQNGRRIYESINTLATAMRVKEIVTVPELEALTDVYGIIVNMNDYNVGADKGGAVATFEDFDIDYNQQKYLMETRASGSLVKPKSAIVLKKAAVAG